MTTFKIFVKDVVKKDGSHFTAYESVAKDGKKVNVRFCPGVTAPTKNCSIEVEWGSDAWIDKRYFYPLVRVKKYNMVETLDDAPFTRSDDNIF